MFNQPPWQLQPIYGADEHHYVRRAVLWWHSVGLCTVLMTEYGRQGEDGLLAATAQCALKQGPMELPEALKDPDAVSPDEAPALSALFARLAVPAGVQEGQVVDYLCRCNTPSSLPLQTIR